MAHVDRIDSSGNVQPGLADDLGAAPLCAGSQCLGCAELAQLAPGEKEVVAAVVPKDAATFNAQQLFDVCREHLEAGMLPGFIQVLAQIPKTASEKPQDRFLMEAFEREPQSVHRRMVRV